MGAIVAGILDIKYNLQIPIVLNLDNRNLVAPLTTPQHGSSLQYGDAGINPEP